MTTTCSLKNNESSMNISGAGNQSSPTVSSDSLAALLQNPLEAVYSLNRLGVSTSEENSPSLSSTATSTTTEPGLSSIFSFQGMISALVSVASQALDEQAELQNKLGQAILTDMEAKVAEIKKKQAEARRRSHHAFGHLCADICEIVAACSGLGLAVQAMVAEVKSLKDHKSFSSEFKKFFVDTGTKTAENPSLGPTLKVLSITAAVLMILTACFTDGATMAIALLLLMVATQIPIEGKTGTQWLSAGIAKGLEKAGVPADKANIIGDSVALAMGIVTAMVTGSASESISMGMMVFGAALGSLSSNIGKDTLALTDLKGKAAMALEYSLIIGLSTLAVLAGISGGMMVADEQASEASKEVSGKLSKIVKKLNDELADNRIAKLTQKFNDKISSLVPEKLAQLGEKHMNEFVIRLTQLMNSMQIANGSLTIVQSAGDILIALMTEAIQKLQADLTELTTQNSQVQDNIQNIEDNLSKNT